MVKTRNGFVSNSSSSSFILCFKEKPKNAKYVKEAIFFDEETFTSDWSDTSYKTKEASQVIFKDMQLIKNTKNYKKICEDNYWGLTEAEMKHILSKCDTEYVYNFQCGNECGGGIITELEGCNELRRFAKHVESMH